MAQTYKIRRGLRACATIWLPRHLSCGSSSQMAAKIKKSLPSCRWPLAVAFLRKCHGTSTWHQKVSSEMLETCKRPVLFQSTLLKERSRLEFWSLVYKKCTVPYHVSKSRPVYWKLQTVDKAIKPDKQEINKNPLCPERFWFLARTEPGDLWHSQRQKKPITRVSSKRQSKWRSVSLACRRHSLLRGCVPDCPEGKKLLGAKSFDNPLGKRHLFEAHASCVEM